MEFQQYPSYKKFNDGVLNSLPQSWNNKPFWAVFKKSEITNKVNEQLLSVYLDRGVILYSDGGGLVHKPAESLEKYQLVHVDDFVMNNQQAWRGSVGISPYQGIVSPAYLIFKPNKELNPQFLKYQLRDKYFIDQFMISSLSVGTIQRQIKNHLLRAIQIPIPSQEEQQKIAAFLDTETTRIDNLISKQEKLIKLLEEQRKSIISHVVTKGLNPNVPMKDSGVDWLGDVPEHWKIGKIKRWFNTLSGGTPDSNNYVRYYKDGTHPWLRTTDLNNGVLTSFEIGITDEAIKESSCKYVPENSVLIAMYGGDGTIGKNALLRFKSTINQALCALIPNTHFNPEYTFFYIQFYRPYWMVNAMGGRKDPNINQQQIQDAYFLQPPIAEQNKIVDFLKKEHSRIDIFVLKQNKLIEKLKEYRSSIISHAVTGKIDVREFSA
jgi:type I restriction enzyme, S subunit